MSNQPDEVRDHGKDKEKDPKSTQEHLRWYADHCSGLLLQNETAQEYLEKRGVCDLRLIDEMKIGYADGTLARWLPPSNTNRGREVRRILRGAGLLTDGGREILRGCLLFPLRRPDGEVIGFEHLRIDGREEPEATTARKPGFISHDCLKYNEIIICEGPIDLLTFRIAGYRNVMCATGPDLPEETLEILALSDVELARLVFNGNTKSDEAALLLARELAKHGIRCLCAFLPRRMSPNTYAAANPPTERSLGDLLHRAKPFRDPLANEVMPNVSLSRRRTSAAGAARAGAEAARDGGDRERTPAGIAPPFPPVPAAAAAPAGTTTAPPREPDDGPEVVRGDVVRLRMEDRLYIAEWLGKNPVHGALPVALTLEGLKAG